MSTLLATPPGGNTPWNPADVNNSLQNYYKFDEDTGTIAYDNGLGTHENATLSSSTLWTSAGEMNSGIALTGGTSGSVKVSSFAADSSFTFAAWINPNTVSANSYIASTANNAFSLYINSSGELVATGTTGSVTDTTALTAGTWCLVSVTYSNGTLTLYKYENGGLGGEVGSATATTTTGTTTLYIGGNGGSVSSFNGTIDEVRYYSTALLGSMNVIGYANLVGGSGYNTSSSGFSVSFSGGGGSGAAATAYANSSGQIITLLITNSGSGYTSAPTMSFTAGDGSGASATANMSVSQMAYLYQQYGPQLENSFYAPEAPFITGKTAHLMTDAISQEESSTATDLTFTWTATTVPPGITAPIFGSGQDTNGGSNIEVTFSGAGYYVFEVVATNSLGQTATAYMPVDVAPIPTIAATITPSSINLAPSGTQQFTANCTAAPTLRASTSSATPCLHPGGPGAYPPVVAPSPPAASTPPPRWWKTWAPSSGSITPPPTASCSH